MTGEAGRFSNGDEERYEALPPQELEAFGLKEALRILSETDEEDVEVLRVIDEALQQPVPELDDEMGWIIYRDRMRTLVEFAETLDVSTARNRLLRERIEARLSETETNS